MALDFPSNPTVGQTYLGWTWTGTAWVVTAAQPVPFYNNTGRNLADNALFNIQQRGTGPFSGVGYTLDRWHIALANDTVSTQAVSLADSDRAAIGDEAATSAMQCTVTGSSTAGSYSVAIQPIESVRRLSSKTITVSFWARATSGTPRVGIGWWQAFGSGGSPSASLGGNIGTTPALSATWQRYTVTNTIPSTAGKVLGTSGGDYTELDLWLSDQGTYAARSGGIGVQSGTVQFWGVQVEIGSQATPLEKLVPEVDLARCQRFYQPGYISLLGYGGAGNFFGYTARWMAPFRAAPTISAIGGGWSTINVTNVNIVSTSTTEAQFYGVTTATGYCSIALTYGASADL
jgi:hypothetical protein